MDEIADAIARVLRADESIYQATADPPEGISDYPTALVLEVNGEAGLGGYRGLWEPIVEARIWLLVQPRRQLPEAVRATRPWTTRLLRMFAQNDVLTNEAGESLAEITGMRWTMGNLTYGGVDHSGIELVLVARMDLQVEAECE